MSFRRLAVAMSVLASMVSWPGCTSSSTSGEPPAQVPLGKYIRHVVIIIQENRSTDNMWNNFPGAEAPLEDPGNVVRNRRDSTSGGNRE